MKTFLRFLFHLSWRLALVFGLIALVLFGLYKFLVFLLL